MALPLRPPTLVAELELDSAVSEQVAGWAVDSGHRAARVLVRLHGEPLGMADIPQLTSVCEAEVASRIRGVFAERIERHLATDRALAGGYEVGSPTRCPQGISLRRAQLPFASVVIQTCGGRTDHLLRCVRSLLDLDYPAHEVVLVDNRPLTSGASELVRSRFGSDPRVRLVQEWKPGLSAARNRGLRAARGAVVAFTDDDVVVDREWLARLVIALLDEDADCATGLILPYELRTPAQMLREDLGGFGKGYDRRVFEREGDGRNKLYPYSPGAFGSGASAAFWREPLLRFGGFDEVLGAGTRALGGEDLDIYLSFILTGHRIVYEPRALLWHRHHESEREFRGQVLHYGVGLSAFLTKRFLASKQERRAILRRVPTGLRMLVDGVHAAAGTSTDAAARGGDGRSSPSAPRSLAMLQLAGMVYGPVAYLRSRRHERLVTVSS